MFSGMPPALSIAYWTEISLAGLALATFLSIFVLRLLTERHTARVTAGRLAAQKCLGHWLDNEPSSPALGGAVALRELIKLWIYHIGLVDGPHRRALVSQGKAAGLTEHVGRLLASGKVPAELLALKAAAILKEESLVPGILPLLGSRNNIVSLFAAEAIAESSRLHALRTVLPFVMRQQDWAEKSVVGVYRSIVRNSPDVTRLLLHLALRHDARAQAFVAKFLGSQPFELRAPYLSVLLRKAADDKVISACLDGLHEPLSAEVARQYLDHPRWHVRVHAVQAIGRIGSARDETALIKCLADEQWWVRYRAAQALVGLPWLAQGGLTDIYNGLVDPFSRDILQQAAAEGGSSLVRLADVA